MNTSASFKKRTNVRTRKLALHATRAGLRILSPHAPGLAARWAERIFLTARRHERPFWEVEALKDATPGRVALDGKWIPTWTWSPPGVTGTAPAILLVHGWEGRGSQLATFVAPLLESGLRVIAFDAPGHGDSPLPRASLVEHARAAFAVARSAGPVHGVIGHSVGGAAALFATRLGLEAARFALIAPPSTPERFASELARILEIEDAVKEEMIERLETRYALPFTAIDAAIDAARLASPLLVVHDAEDPVVSVDHGRRLATVARRGELLVTNGLGHRAILRDPSVVATVARFVAAGAPAVRSFAETLDGELFMPDTRW